MKGGKDKKDATFGDGSGGADGSDGDGEGDGAGGVPTARRTARPGPANEQKEETYYDAIKREMSERQARTRAVMDGLDATNRLAMEGVRPGAYVRMRLRGVPCELVEHHDPCTPLLVGGLGQGEEKMGLMKLRFKRHRWFPKLLKARDPLMLSVGWRRFQSLPVYAIEDHNRRLRNLKVWGGEGGASRVLGGVQVGGCCQCTPCRGGWEHGGVQGGMLVYTVKGRNRR
eukprot:59930-Chlamydomonas_euryale.AAC.1